MHFTLADLVTDITYNGCEAGASLVELEVSESAAVSVPVPAPFPPVRQGSPVNERGNANGGEFRFLVKDNGKGMTKEELNRALDPFVTDGIKHPNRKVGLGLPFLIQTTTMSGGGWDIQSEKGKGTTVTGWFDTGNIDTPPMGDIPGMFRTILMFNSKAEIYIRRKAKLKDGTEKEYEIRKSELVDALGDLEDAGSLVLLDKYLRSLENEE